MKPEFLTHGPWRKRSDGDFTTATTFTAGHRNVASEDNATSPTNNLYSAFTDKLSRSATTKPEILTQMRLRKPSPSDNIQHALPSTQHQKASSHDNNVRPLQIRKQSAPPPPDDYEDDEELPPPPLKTKNSVSSLSSSAPFSSDMLHQRTYSTDSRDSSRISVSSKYSVATNGRRPGVASIARAVRASEDVPPVPSVPAVPPTANYFSRPYVDSIQNGGYQNSGRGGYDNGYMTGFAGSNKRDDSPRRPGYARASPSRGMYPLDEEEVTPSSAPATMNYGQHHLKKSSSPLRGIDEMNHSQWLDSEQHGRSLSVSSLARSLGLPGSSSTESSWSEFSRSDVQSEGSSMSSVPSEGAWSRRKPSSEAGTMPNVNTNVKIPAQSHMIYDSPIFESPTQFSPPPPPPKEPMVRSVGDSPTEPAISQGSMSLISESRLMPGRKQPSPLWPNVPRSATAPPVIRARPKGMCRGCGEVIMGKCVSSADGRLTGRYHKACFVCHACYAPFQSTDFYVHQDRPYCAYHYHELNGSLCSSCNMGIEGQYLETIERTGHDAGDRRKFHPCCLRCNACDVSLRGDYYEWYGQVYCEQDIWRVVADAQTKNYGQPMISDATYETFEESDHFGGYDGYGYEAPPSRAKRTPEKRTTRLMVI